VLGIPLLFLVTSGSWLMLPNLRKTRTDLITRAVHFDRLQLAVHENGIVAAAHNSDIVCRVKARTHGSTVATTIKWVIDDGSLVKRGDVVAELDDSGLVEELKTQNIAVVKAQSDWLQAEETYKIVRSQNQGDIANAATAVELAEIDLRKYREGDYVQAHKDVEGRLTQAQADLEQSKERVAWSERMLRKGFQTRTQSQAEHSREEGCQLALEKVQEELRVLEKYTRRRTLVELESNFTEAKRALLRVKSQALAKEVQADSDRLGKRLVYEHEHQRARDLEEQIQLCILRSPRDGMVVHYLSDQARGGRGAQQGTIAQGEPVREGQRLMQIPDLGKMVVETNVHEAQLMHVHGADHRGGDPALIHLHAFPDRVWHGHVKFVSSVASEREWWLTGAKLYTTTVEIDDPAEELKPGMTAEVTILGEQPREHVLTLPAEALVSPVKPGEGGKVFVVTPDGPSEREVVVGLSNEATVEVTTGIQDGEEVVLNPEALAHKDKEGVTH
jgi:multidrug resistance efflux pump